MRVLVGLAPAFVGFGLVQAIVGPFHVTGFVIVAVGMILWAFK